MTHSTVCPLSDIVEFRPKGDAFAWGFLETKHAQLGLLYLENPTPQLTVAPPVRLPEGGAGRFLDAVLDEYERTGDELWMAIGCDPSDGEVAMNVSPKSREQVDDDIIRIKTFFDEQFPVLARLCLPDTEACDSTDESEDEDVDEVLRMLLEHTLV